VTLRALAAPHAQLAGKLGANKVTASSVLITRLPRGTERKVAQSLTLRMDDKGNFAAVKNTDPQYGNELIWTGGWLYARLRHSKFVKRRARAGEPRMLAERMYGYLPGYLGLLGRFIDVEAAGEARHLGRAAVKVRLKLDRSPAPLRGARGRSRRWRRTVIAKAIKGEALFDARTGAVLAARLAASWTFNPPKGTRLPRSGIPTAIDGSTVGTMSLTYRQGVEALGGKVPAIGPPPDEEVAEIRRHRLEIERQMLTGERPIPERWSGQ
jgi:hypothetical protein